MARSVLAIWAKLEPAFSGVQSLSCLKSFPSRKRTIAISAAMERVYGMCAWMTSITGALAILATMALWALPGLQVEPQVPAKTAAAAMAG